MILETSASLDSFDKCLSLSNRKYELKLLLSGYVCENSMRPLLSKNLAFFFFKIKEIKFLHDI